MMCLGESGIGFRLRDQLIVGPRLLHRQINVEAKQWHQAYDRHIVRSRANLPKLSPVHSLSAHHLGTAALGCPVERSSTILSPPQSSRAVPGTTAEGGCPHIVFYSPAAFGPLRGLSASASSMTGAGPEIPPSLRTRQKCTIISTEATIGIPMQCQM